MSIRDLDYKNILKIHNDKKVGSFETWTPSSRYESRLLSFKAIRYGKIFPKLYRTSKILPAFEKIKVQIVQYIFDRKSKVESRTVSVVQFFTKNVVKNVTKNVTENFWPLLHNFDLLKQQKAIYLGPWAS